MGSVVALGIFGCRPSLPSCQKNWVARLLLQGSRNKGQILKTPRGKIFTNVLALTSKKLLCGQLNPEKYFYGQSNIIAKNVSQEDNSLGC